MAIWHLFRFVPVSNTKKTWGNRPKREDREEINKYDIICATILIVAANYAWIWQMQLLVGIIALGAVGVGIMMYGTSTEKGKVDPSSSKR